jgi:hypothetical protein
MFINPGDLDLLTRPAAVREVSEQNNVLSAGESARGNGAGRFLDRDPLIIAVNGLR